MATTPARPDTPLFQAHDVLEVRLEGPLASVLKKKSGRPEYPFEITVDGNSHPVEVRYRGHSRLRLCRFPPLRLDFPRGEMAGTVFAGLNKVKMVTHCKPGGGAAEDSVLNEYLAYRVFNLLSPASYRVRLLRVSYVDSEGRTRKLDRPYHAYLIEPADMLAERLQAEVLEVGGVRFAELSERQVASVSVFEYLIGNSDWSLARPYESDQCCHNIDLFDTAEGWLPVPYDFDLSMLADARYRGPFAARQARSRSYGGYCRSTDESLAAALADIRARQDDILRLAREVPAMDEEAREKRVEFIASYFEQGDEAMLRRFRQDCQG